MMGCVYLLSFPNGKGYVGIVADSDVHRRIRGHVRGKRVVGNALRKYGVESVEISVLARRQAWDSLAKRERYFIKKLGTRHPDGYNMTDGGEGARGRKPTPLMRKTARKNIRGTLKKLFADSDFRERHAERARKTLARSKKNPAFILAQRKASKKNLRRLNADAAFCVKRDRAIRGNWKKLLAAVGRKK